VIEVYFESLEKTVQAFPHVETYILQKKIYNLKLGYIKCTLLLKDYTRLEFIEVRDMDLPEKIKYRYHYMKKDNTLIFRYDNAPHYPGIQTFPHHKHTSEGSVEEAGEPTLETVLLEVATWLHQSAGNPP
jgi:hypothetical protein